LWGVAQSNQIDEKYRDLIFGSFKKDFFQVVIIEQARNVIAKKYWPKEKGGYYG
jgi:hypothetical protein